MTKKILLITGIGMLASFIIIGVIVYRNTMLDKGMSALKEENSAKAIHYLRPLAMMGDSEAQVLLGEMFAFGLGVIKDDIEAINWFQKTNNAAKHEYHVAERYRMLYEEKSGKQELNAAEALKWYRISAENGSLKAAEFLGRHMQKA